MASKLKYLIAASIVTLATASGAFAQERGGVGISELDRAAQLLFGESSEYSPSANLVWPSFSGFRQGRVTPLPRIIDDTPHVCDTCRSRSGLDWSGPTPRFLYRADDYDLGASPGSPRRPTVNYRIWWRCISAGWRSTFIR